MGSLSNMNVVFPVELSILPDAPDFPVEAVDALNAAIGEAANVEEAVVAQAGLEEQAIPTATIPAAVGAVVQFQLPSALSVLAQQYLNEHTGGFTIAHARTLM
jgi:hypothetical protein